ncbi:SgcJ/EcaC family oxidoreductase [Streptomyces orinoci]|uniref:SgcJ/EcaC family oxidoreductase n=1 Tax=Streptomyces orinoci TaxID=67339 RepID=A0ABV3JWZ0_STRON|nr:SgcJ/EcaC family oxidoreductase [Streptomyces orinoci]
MRRTHSLRAALALAAVLCAGIGPIAGAEAEAARPAVVRTTQPPSRERIAALFDRWNAALRTGDAERVADLYARDAVLLPTVSSRIRTNRAGIVDYFEHFLLSKPVGRIQERYINVLSDTAAVDTGLYRFTLTNEDGSTSHVDARYTFVYVLRGGRWLILNHHSSAVPAGD